MQKADGCNPPAFHFRFPFQNQLFQEHGRFPANAFGAKGQFLSAGKKLLDNLSQLLRALELRFQEFEIRDANKPIVARDGERIYLSMPLPPSSALPPSPDAFKVSTAPAQRGAMVPVKRRTHSSIAVPSTQTPVMENGIDIPGEAEGLRDGLLKVAAHAGKILRFLRSVGTQQRIVDFARTSLLALSHQVTHGGKE